MNTNKNIIIEKENNKIPVQNFVKEYKELTPQSDYARFFKKHIIKEYVNYEDKVTICNKIIQSSFYIYDKKGEKSIRIFKMNSPARYMNYCISLIDTYTDIEIRFGEHVLEDFNALDKEGLVDQIISVIPDDELKKFETILNMQVDDVLENERSIGRFVECIGNGINEIADSIVLGLKQVVEWERLNQNIVN